MSKSEMQFKIIRLSAEEYNDFSNRGLNRRIDFSEHPASVDWKHNCLYVNRDVVPEGLEAFIAAHEAAELKARKRINRYEVEAHKRGIDAEYAAAKRAGRLQEQHNFMSGIITREIQKGDKNGWADITGEKRDDLAYRLKVFRKLSGR